ncbi:MAG: hypothetical protein LBC80_06095 [Treponema sp.]|nr:hypothetical protein [Treponema sp.]
MNTEIAGLDITKGLRRYGNKKDDYLDVLRLFASGVSSMLSEIETFNKEKLSDYRIRTHGIKGACQDIYAEQTGKEASDLEEAAKAGDIGYITRHNPAFLVSIKKLIADIEDMLGNQSKGGLEL